MAYPRTIRNFNAFVDGRGYFGIVSAASLPQLQLNTSDFRGAGMDAPVPIDMGMQAMTAELTFKEWVPEIITTFGARERFVLRPGAMGEEDFTADTYIATVGGRITMNDVGNDLTPGSDNLMKITMGVDYYRLEKDGQELLEIDIERGVRTIGGVDQMGELRSAMGL